MVSRKCWSAVPFPGKLVHRVQQLQRAARAREQRREREPGFHLTRGDLLVRIRARMWSFLLAESRLLAKKSKAVILLSPPFRKMFSLSSSYLCSVILWSHVIKNKALQSKHCA